MAELVKMVDIAKQAGVSISTVGHVLKGTGANNRRVGKKTASRVREIAKKLNYRPNLAAMQLAGKQSKLVGVLMDPKPTEANNVRLAQIGCKIREMGYHLMTLYEQPEPKLVGECLNEFLDRGVDGIICMHHMYPGHPYMIPQIITDSAIKNVVFIDQPTLKNASFIGLDYTDIGHQITKYLYEQGRHRIGFVVSDLEWYCGPRMLQGYKEGLDTIGMGYDERLTWIGTQHRKKDSNLQYIDAGTANEIIDDLVVTQKVDSIITGDDHWAAQILNTLVKRGYNVPKDVAITGVSNLHLGEYTRPMLTTADLQFEKIASRAVDMLMEMIENKNDKKVSRNLIKPKIIIRESA